jgi:hypothetical protein
MATWWLDAKSGLPSGSLRWLTTCKLQRYYGYLARRDRIIAASPGAEFEYAVSPTLMIRHWQTRGVPDPWSRR